MKLIVAFAALLGILNGANGLRLNITQLDNCVDIPMHYNEAQVHVVSVDYQKEDDNTCYILHGKYEVKMGLTTGDNELFISTYMCPLGTEPPCLQNEMVFKEGFTCERFHTDKTGPWSMFAEAIDQTDKCIERKGLFEFNGAILKGEYLEKYMTVGKGRYRIKMLFHKLGEDMAIEHLRGCIELDFDIID